MMPAREVKDADQAPPPHHHHPPPPMPSTAADADATSDATTSVKSADGAKSPADEKTRKIPPIVFVPLLGAFLVITIVPSVLSNVINKSPAPTPAPAPASNGGSSGTTGVGEGMATPTPSSATPTTTKAPTTPAPPTGPPTFSLSTTLAATPVNDIAFHGPSQTFLGVDDSIVWTWSLLPPAVATPFYGIRGGSRLAIDAAGNVYVVETAAFNQYVTQYSAASNYTLSMTLATPTANLPAVSVAATPSTPAMDVVAATSLGALLAWNQSAPTTFGAVVMAAGSFDQASDMTSRGGLLYIADGTADCIRRIVLATGAADVVAGQCNTRGFADGAAASSLWKHPTGIAIDYYGDLYVSDTGNHIVRKIDLATNVVTTIAGTPSSAGLRNSATNASTGLFNAPQGLAINPAMAWKSTSGMFALYVADSGNACVRKVAWG
ncbi:hypothetical protein DYB31_012653 [Aphanomyces astaci]|uniref:SMP-30/Gluconolactonase/LRE-like region domain-containing protein n=1 Tax=Aphanomyces astaci TaxID=112090 RepID=A0A397EU77_APHAT|nr:hypothetical protein DYB31_012653 [Aphanomyces astaci]